MGEYAEYKGGRIKVGTTEDMAYLRPDQIDLVKFESPYPNLDPFLFRFPFPAEDHIEPGDFADHAYGLTVWGYDIPEGVTHDRVQFKNTRNNGILVMLDCPFSEAGRNNGIKYQYNGFRGPVKIVRQRVWQGRWVTVLECGGCGSWFRLPTVTDAGPLIKAVNEMSHAAMTDGNTNLSMMYATVSARIEMGYEQTAP